MAIEYRTVTDANTGKQYEEVYKGGVLVAVSLKPSLEQGNKVRLEPRLLAAINEWQTWKLAAAEATARNEIQAYRTALDNREDAAWAEVMALIPAWSVIEIGA